MHVNRIVAMFILAFLLTPIFAQVTTTNVSPKDKVRSLKERIMNGLNSHPTQPKPKRNTSSLELLKQTVLTKTPRGKLKPLKVNLTLENNEITIPEEYFVDMHCPGADEVPIESRTMCSAMFEDGGCIPGFEPDVTWEFNGEWIENTIDNWRVVVLEDGRLLFSPIVVEDSGRIACYIYGDLAGSAVLTVVDYWAWLWSLLRPVLNLMLLSCALLFIVWISWGLHRKHKKSRDRLEAFTGFYELKRDVIERLGKPPNSMYSSYRSQMGMLNRNHHSAMKIIRRRELENNAEMNLVRKSHGIKEKRNISRKLSVDIEAMV